MGTRNGPLFVYRQRRCRSIPHYSRYEDSFLCLTRFDGRRNGQSTVATGDYKAPSSLCLCTLPRDSHAIGIRRRRSVWVHRRKHSSVATLETCKMKIHDGQSIFWGRGDQGSCDRGDLISTDSILCTSDSAREDSKEACPRSQRTDRTDITHTVKCRRSDKSPKKMDLMTLIQENPPQKP
ncbi:LOW QUALITY PROTEIN: hypothetical protein IFM47457_02693 [Aspergillus lentulus]|nr:LOW QUALITY PROTEIN: hypothetical protein IFM47457_02693 [Aspergillus lentulus]